MEIDPHTLHQILLRIGKQMRCPQCSEYVPVEFHCIRLTGNDFLLLQLRCNMCEAYIVLHASFKGALLGQAKDGKPLGINASSYLCTKEEERDALRNALKKSSGSFEQYFKDMPGVTPGETMIV